MKILKPVGCVAIGFLAGWALGFCTRLNSRAASEKQNDDLRSSLMAAKQAHDEATAERDSWRNRAEEQEQAAAEVHRLRAEVSRLMATSQGRPAIGAGPVNEKQLASSPPMTEFRKGIIELASAPPAIAAAIAAYAENGRVRIGRSMRDDGRVTFGVKGELADGRAIAMVLAEDGSLLEKSTEIPAEAIPAHIQEPVAKAFGNVPISGGREIIEGERLMYELVSKSPEARMQITVRGDGTILGYNAKLKAPESQ